MSWRWETAKRSIKREPRFPSQIELKIIYCARCGGGFSYVRAPRRKQKTPGVETKREIERAAWLLLQFLLETRYAQQQRKRKQSNCKFFYLTPQLSQQNKFCALRRLFIARFFMPGLSVVFMNLFVNTKSHTYIHRAKGKLKEWLNRMCWGNLSAMLTVTWN